MDFKNSIFIKTLKSLYNLNMNKSNEVHSSVIDAIFNALVMVNDDINRAKLEMALNTATGVWLDYWGDFFNIPRERHEKDEDYSARIIQETLEPKVTLMALKKAAARWLSRKKNIEYKPEDIKMIEPWKEVLKYSQRGFLSGNARMTDQDYWRYGVIDVSVPDTESLSLELISYLNTIKAAGVRIYYSYRPNWPVMDGYSLENPVLSNRQLNQFTSYFQPYAKSYKKALYTSPDFDFIVDDDSGFNKGLNSIDHPVSSTQEIWWEHAVYRDFPLVWGKIKMYEDSPLISLEYLSEELLKDYDSITIDDILVEEDKDNPYISEYLMGLYHDIYDALQMMPSKDINTVTIGDLLNVELNDHRSYEVMFEFNILLSDLKQEFPNKSTSEITFEDICSIKQKYIVKERRIGRLTHSLAPTQISRASIIDISMANNLRDFINSPVIRNLIALGFLKGMDSSNLLSSPLSPQDILRYYSYVSLEDMTVQDTIDFEEDFCYRARQKFVIGSDSYKKWLSENWLYQSLQTDLPMDQLENNINILHSLIKEELVVDNVLMPTVITTIGNTFIQDGTNLIVQTLEPIHSITQKGATLVCE